MKTLRVLFSVIFCILLSYSLSSCGGGDDDDVTPPDSGQTGGSPDSGSGNGAPSNPSTNTSKKLVRVDIDEDYEDTTIKFQYDSKGNLSFVSVAEEHEISEFTYQYTGDKILMTGIEERELDGSNAGEIVQRTYYLVNGKVVSIKHEEHDADNTDEEDIHELTFYNLKYDNTENRLAHVSVRYQYTDYESTYEERFSWLEDKLVGIGSSYDGGANTYYDYFNYNAEPLVCKGFFPCLDCLDMETLDNLYLLWAKPELASMKVNTLPYSSDDEVYTYELDDDGYIKKMCVQEDGDVPTFYNFTWK